MTQGTALSSSNGSCGSDRRASDSVDCGNGRHDAYRVFRHRASGASYVAQPIELGFSPDCWIWYLFIDLLRLPTPHVHSGIRTAPRVGRDMVPAPGDTSYSVLHAVMESTSCLAIDGWSVGSRNSRIYSADRSHAARRVGWVGNLEQPCAVSLSRRSFLARTHDRKSRRGTKHISSGLPIADTISNRALLALCRRGNPGGRGGSGDHLRAVRNCHTRSDA